jgi:hypothetical protein
VEKKILFIGCRISDLQNRGNVRGPHTIRSSDPEDEKLEISEKCLKKEEETTRMEAPPATEERQRTWTPKKY